MKIKILVSILFILLYSFTSKAQYTKFFDFSGSTNGKEPFGSLISDGTFLYGTTASGGILDSGTIFKIKLDGTGYTKLKDFTGVNGAYPYGDLVSDGTFLYGMTGLGGINHGGVIFKIKTDGTGYLKIFDFSGPTTGKLPTGSLIYDGTFLCGMTKFGGSNNFGTVFKIKPDGTGFLKLLDFAGSSNGIYPCGSLLFDGTFLYGMASQGGANSNGTIFKIKPDGTGFVKLLDFNSTITGALPLGTLISDGTFLYSMTAFGGVNNDGVIFKIKPDGTGFVKLLDFAGTSNGAGPQGSLLYDGINLYGMTNNGGSFGGTEAGVIFKIKTDGTGYSKLYDFSIIPDGMGPLGSLISDGIFIYGMAEDGGSFGDGVIFRLGPTTNIFENNSQTSFTIYPNPTNGIFSLNMNEFQNSKINEVKIINIPGECVYLLANEQMTPTSDLQIDLSSQSNGIYFISIKSENGIATKKIVIQK